MKGLCASLLMVAIPLAGVASCRADQRGPIGVASIAALRGFSAEHVVPGEIAMVAGYYGPGDRGGGSFLFDSTSEMPDDGGVVIAPKRGAGRWLRQFQGGLDVRWFGARGDGSHDDTGAIQRAIDDGAYGLSGVSPGTPAVISDSGTYRITKTLFLGYPAPRGYPFGYVTAQLIGSNNSPRAEKGYVPSIQTDFRELEMPAVAIESGRGSGLRNIAIFGQTSDSYFNRHFFDGNAYRNQWFQPGIFANAEINAQPALQRRFSPYAGVVSNAYSGAAGEISPHPYPEIRIPGYLQGRFGVSRVQYGAWVSAGSYLDNVKAQFFDVGVLFNAFSGNNGDQNRLQRLTIYGCCYGISATQPNMRQFIVSDSSITGCYAAAVDDVHGTNRNGRLTALVNCELDYDCFWALSSNNSGVLLENCNSEGGGMVGAFESVEIRNCSLQVCTYNCYKYPVVRAAGSCIIEGLAIQAIRECSQAPTGRCIAGR